MRQFGRFLVLSFMFHGLVDGPARAAESDFTDSISITLTQAVELALLHNLDIAIQRESVLAASAQYLQAQGQFDPEWTAAHNYGEDTRTLNAESSTAAGGLDRVRSEARNSRISVGGLLPLSTRYSANANNRGSADTFNEFEEEHVSQVGVTLTQPLLQGRGPTLTKTGLRVGRRNMALSQIGFRTQIETVLLNVELAYWDLLRALRDVDARQKSVEAATSLLDRVQVQVEVNTASEADRVQAESGLAQRRIGLIEARRTLEVQDRIFKDLLVPDLLAANALFVPVEDPNLDTSVPVYDDVLQQALNYRPELERAEIDIANAEDQLRLVRNQRLPQLDLEGSVGINGLGGSFSSSVRNGRDGDDNNWSFGLIYRTPWPDRQSRGELAQQESALRQQLLQARKVRRQILLEVGEIYDRLKSSVEQLHANEIAVEFARLSLSNERVKYEVQKSTVHDLLVLETELQETELGLFQTAADYRRNQAQLYRICGTLLDRWGIEIMEDPPGAIRMAGDAAEPDPSSARIDP